MQVASGGVFFSIVRRVLSISMLYFILLGHSLSTCENFAYYLAVTLSVRGLSFNSWGATVTITDKIKISSTSQRFSGTRVKLTYLYLRDQKVQDKDTHIDIISAAGISTQISFLIIKSFLTTASVSLL